MRRSSSEGRVEREVSSWVVSQHVRLHDGENFGDGANSVVSVFVGLDSVAFLCFTSTVRPYCVAVVDERRYDGW